MIAIDANVLIYAGLVPRKSKPKAKKGKRQPGDWDDLATRSKILLHMHKDQFVVLSTIAVAELLVPVPSKKKGKLTAQLSDKFILADFNAHAASIASEIWAKYKNLPTDEQYGSRTVLRADSLIVASVKAVGATEFYTNDKKCRKLADLVMDGRELPTHDPNDMFLANDIAAGNLDI